MTGTSVKTMTTTTTLAAVPRRNSAPRVSLATRAHIDKHDAGLTSVAGAREVIAAIQVRRAVTKLILGHNALGDAGTTELFRFLCTPEGRKYKIAEISLNSNAIGDAGLAAITQYLEGNEHLRELFLQNNVLQGDRPLALALSSAINSSHLSLLSLTTNQSLSSSSFLTTFVSSLDSSTLRELQISALGLTAKSAPALTEFLASPRARALEKLNCNGNTLGLKAVRKLIVKLKKRNFTLLKLEVHANHLRNSDSDSDVSEGTDDDSEVDRKASWNVCELELKELLLRNELLQRKVQSEALALLSYARTLLLRPTRSTHTLSDTYPRTLERTQSNPINSVPHSKPTSVLSRTSTFPFHALPLELQHYILSFFAPTLSAAQRVRVLSFASSSATLRPALPSIKRARTHDACIPDPASLPFGMLGVGALGASTGGGGMGLNMGSMDMGMGSGIGMGIKSTGCSGGRCMGSGGSVLCHRVEARTHWLAETGCTRFETDGRGEREVLQLLRLL
ncbi:RNI-like protein [Phellopilus nigrolimitatus]|nr:RNI-like protein [Phellopilus nigrolimitatus]